MSGLVVIRDTRLKDLLVYWETKRQGRPMPLAGDVAILDLAFILPNLLWVEIEHDPRRYRYRRVGNELERIYGSSIEGLYIDQMPGFLYRRIASRAYAEVVEGREPVCRILSFSMVSWFAKYERLLLPVSSTGDKVDVVLGAIVPEFGPVKS
ncbi:MAG: PAS domain-containing protein [Alphaproteobacteria bacterium]|nr:PAS domain-containing protein [Alphaproteobacteria bacterium]